MQRFSFFIFGLFLSLFIRLYGAWVPDGSFAYTPENLPLAHTPQNVRLFFDRAAEANDTNSTHTGRDKTQRTVLRWVFFIRARAVRFILLPHPAF